MHALKPHYSARLGKYRHLAKKVSRLLKDGSFHVLSRNRQRLLLAKLKARLKSIGHLMPSPQLKGALAGIALLMGTAANVDAQNFAAGVTSPFGIIPGTTLGYQSFADIDGDGDLDLLLNRMDYSTSDPAPEFVFFENTGSAQSPEFSADNYFINPFGISPDVSSQPMLVDLDHDGDLDLISGTLQTGGFLYQENIGTANAPNYGPAEFNPFGLTNSYFFNFASATDLDDDGDIDILGGGFYGNLDYFENIGTPESPSFAAPQPNPFGISTGALIISIPHFCDIDSDGDQDILSFNYNYYAPAEVIFLENTGSNTAPSFAPPVTDPFGITTNGFVDAATLSCADIDADGDPDLFLNESYSGSNIVFYENLAINESYPPSSSDNVVVMPEDGTYIFQPDDFVFTDQNTSDQLQAVQITGLPTKGDLKLGTTNVNVNDVVPANQLGSLTYSPALNEFGNNYTTFKFKVYDGRLYSTDEYSMFFNITPVNDAPTTMDASINASNDFDYVFDASDFPYTDIENQPLGSIKIISLPSKGSLKLGGANVTQGQTILNSQVSALTYSGIAGEMGTAYTSFDFQISDGQLNSTSATMTINLFETLGTSNLDTEIQLRISPNPVTDFLNISFDSPVRDDFQVSIMNADGRILSQMLTKNQASSKSFQLDVASLPANIYFLKIETEKGVSTLKFVKI